MSFSEFLPIDSLKTIDDAIRKAKAEKTGARFYYLLWGTILFIHFLLSYFSIKYPVFKNIIFQLIAILIFPLGGLLSYLKSKNDSRRETAVSLYERVYLFGFGGFAITYGTIFFASVISGIDYSVMLLPILLGFTVFVVGGITKHLLSIVGGVVAILLTGISLNCSYDLQLLVAATASLVTCVIPGYLMRYSNV